MGLLDKAKEKAGGLASKGKEKLENAIKEIGGLAPVLASGGFSLDNVDVGLGLPPSVSVGIGCSSGDEESVQKLLSRDDLSKTQRVLITSLQKVFGMQAVVNRNNFRISGMSVDLSLPPSVSMTLTPVKIVGDNAETAALLEQEETEVPPQ